MRINLTAYTAPGVNYPEYISVNLAMNSDDEVEFTVRSKTKADGSCGDTASIKVDISQFRKIARDLFSFGFTTAA
jgi:hypothetical protein